MRNGIGRGTLAALAVAVLLTGCMRLRLSIDINDDGSGNVEGTVLFDAEVFYEEVTGRPSVPFVGNEADAVCDSLTDAAPEIVIYEIIGQEGASSDLARDGDWCGFEFSFDVPASLDHSETVGALFAPGASLRKVGEEWHFEATFDPSTLDASPVPYTDFERVRLERATKDAEYVVEVKLPGVAVEGVSTATKIDGGTFTWEIDPFNSLDTSMIARTEPAPPFRFKAPLIAAIAVTALGVSGVLWFFVGGREKQPIETAASAAPAEPYYDSAFGVWVLEDPVKGKLWRDEKNDRWVPF